MARVLSVPLVIVVLAVGAAPASAGTYPMNQCRYNDGRLAAVNGGWNADGTTPGKYARCSEPSGGFGSFALGPDIPANSSGSASLQVAPGRPAITLTAFDAEVGTGSGPWSGPVTFAINCGLQRLATRAVPDPGRPSFGPERIAGPATCSGAQEMRFGIQCGGAPCRTEDPSRAVDLRRLTLTLSESEPPTGELRGGSLLGGGTQTGTRDVTVAASDADSGVARVAVRLGSVVVGSAVQGACAYDDWNACPTSFEAVGLAVDTTKVPDGTHRLLLDVTDAAENTKTVDRGTITVGNNPGVQPPELPLVAVAGKRFKGRFGKHKFVQARLAAPGGAPVANQPVEVLSRPLVNDSSLRAVGTARTDADGNVRWRAPAGPSRQIQFRVDTPSYRSTSDVELTVPARASVRVDRRRIRAGRQISISGRLLGQPRPGNRTVTAVFEGRSSGRWRVFASVPVNGRGRFSARYRFAADGPTRTYSLRVRLRPTPGAYPYAAGFSRARTVRVRGAA